MKSLLLVVLCVALVAASPARAAGAERGAARIAISKGAGTEPCMAEAALRRAVEARLRRAAFRGDLPATLQVLIVFERTSAAWSAELTVRDGSGQFLGQRSLVTEAAHCSALDDSLALVVALLVDAPPSAPQAQDPSAPGAEADAHSGTPSEPQPVPASPTTAALKPPTPPPHTRLSLPRNTIAPREPWRFDVSLGGVAAVGNIPGLALGGELGLGARAPRLPELRLFADGYAQCDQQRNGSNSGAHFELASVGLEVCALDVSLGALRWFGCAGQSLGRLKVAAYGFDLNASSEHMTYALLARAGLRFPLIGRVAGRLGIRAELPLARAIFDYGSRDGRDHALYETKPITAALDLGLIVQL